MQIAVAHTTLISTDVFASHLDGSWVIVDCRYDLRDERWGLEQYRTAHIPGAVYASLSHDLAAPPSGTNGRHPLPCVETIEATFGRLGISPGTQVVIYDQDVGMYASRMWWMLRYMGHDAAAVGTPAFVVTYQRGAEWAARGSVTIPLPPELAR